MLTLTSTLKETPIKELLKAFNTNKGYLYFDISVFNVGAAISIKCTDIYCPPNPNTWNGYDFMLENDYTTNQYIAQTISEMDVNSDKLSPYYKTILNKAIAECE